MKRRALRERLSAIASFVKPGARLCDVGSDHARLPIWLFNEGIIGSAVITDIRPSPLFRARAGIERAGYMARSQFFCCDGLSDLPRGDFDTAVMAGMGGETIAGILERAPWLKEGYSLILQPNSGAYELRKLLCENGYKITGGRIAFEKGRYYCIITAEGGDMPPYSECELHAGREYVLAEDPLFGEYADHMIGALKSAAEGMTRSGQEENGRAGALLALIEEIEKMKAGVCYGTDRADI